MAFGATSGMSQMGGLLDWLKDPIVKIITDFDYFLDVITNLGNLILTYLSFYYAALLYGIQVGFFWLLDFVQTVFRRVAGLDTYWFRSGTSVDEHTGDIVESLLLSDTVWTIFVSVLFAAIVLLFVSTIIAVLKTELNEKDNAKGPVIKQALKAVAYFVIVPVVCVLGVTLANIFLRTFDAATQISPTSISGQIFAASSYSANRVRNGQYIVDDYNDTENGWGEWARTKQRLAYITITETDYIYETVYNTNKEGKYIDYDGNVVPESEKVPKLDINGNVVKQVKLDPETGKKLTETKQVSPITKSSSQAEIANFIDQCFLYSKSFNSTPGSNVSGVTITDPALYTYTLDGYMAGYSYYIHRAETDHFNTFEKCMVETTYIYYDLWQYNWLIGYLASFTILMLMLNLMIGVAQRMFDLTVLFIVSPAFIALMPLDNGQRYGKWREEFVKRTIACYGPIIGINLAFTVLTIAQRINIFGPGDPNGPFFNALMQCIFVLTAILCVKDFGKLINSIVGGQDISENKSAQIRGMLMKGAGAALTGAAMGANFLNDSRKLNKKVTAGEQAKQNLKDYDSKSEGDKMNAFADKIAEQGMKVDIEKHLARTNPNWNNLTKAQQQEAIEQNFNTYKGTAGYRRRLATDRSAIQARSDFKENYEADDAKQRKQLKDAVSNAEVDIKSARGTRYGHFESGYSTIKKNLRPGFMKEWDDAGAGEAINSLRGVYSDTREAITGRKSLKGIADDLTNMKKQKDLIRDSQNKVDAEEYARIKKELDNLRNNP